MDIGKTFFTMRVVRKPPEQVAQRSCVQDVPSLEVFKVRLERALSNAV